jgi:hypothetical protein
VSADRSAEFSHMSVSESIFKFRLLKELNPESFDRRKS